MVLGRKAITEVTEYNIHLKLSQEGIIHVCSIIISLKSLIFFFFTSLLVKKMSLWSYLPWTQIF